MKILMLVNWKVKYCDAPPSDTQPPDYDVPGCPYWFFRHFNSPPQVDVIDIRSFSWLERLEQNKLRFYVIQALRAIPKMRHYDLIISHGMQSGVVISLWRRWFETKAKHLVFDIGSFNSAAESGRALRIMQYAARSIDGLIYHTGVQLEYYRRKFPWLVEKAEFIPFGADLAFFGTDKPVTGYEHGKLVDKQEITILCVGYAKRDWRTLTIAFSDLLKQYPNHDIKLKLIGKKSGTDSNIIYMPYVPIRQLIAEIQAADFCVLPLEPFNYSIGQMTLLQQMAVGKAVVAAHVPSLVEYGRDGETVLFYRPGDYDDLKDKMLRLLTDDLKRNQIAAAAAASIKNEFSEEGMAAKIEACVCKLLS